MMEEEKGKQDIGIPPRGLAMAMLVLVGPGIVWCAEYIGSGEVILTTRTGAILGTTVIWAIYYWHFSEILDRDERGPLYCMH